MADRPGRSRHSVMTMNIISVKLFGEMEFWASIIKVAALVTFLVGRYHLPRRPLRDRRCNNRFQCHQRQRRPAAHRHVLPGDRHLRRHLRLCRCRTRRYRGRRDGRAREGHAARHQLGDRAYRGVLRRFIDSAGTAAALHHLPGRREPVRHVLLQDRCPRRRRHHEPGGADRRHVQPQRGPLLHRPHPALDGDERQRPARSPAR